MILTPEFLADLARWNAANEAARDEYWRHESMRSCRGPSWCVTPGCSNAAKNAARRAA